MVNKGLRILQIFNFKTYIGENDMKNRIAFILLCLFTLTAIGCSGNEQNRFLLTISRNDKIMLTCYFDGEDKNKDDFLEADELTDFRETEDYSVSEPPVGSMGFREYANIDEMPALDHSLEDIKAFRFNLTEFKKGKTVLDYRTETKRKFKYGEYYFWRTVEITDEGKDFIGFIHGVGDGTEGLGLTMICEGLSFNVSAVPK